MNWSMRCIVLFLACSLVVAACGTRLTDQERALYVSGTGEQGAEGGAVIGGAGTTRTTAAGGAGTGTTGSADGGATGDSAAGGGPAAALPCAAPTTEIGVTDSAITLGGTYQLSGILPGIGQGGAWGAQAYADYLNDDGGLCGRQVEYLVLDDGFDAARNRDQTSVLIDRALSIVGGFSGADDGGARVLAGTNVFDLFTAVTEQRDSLPNHWAPVQDGRSAPELKYMLENGVTKVAVLYTNAAAGRKRALESAQQARGYGMEVVLELAVSPTQFSFASTAQAIADRGAQVLLAHMDINGSVQLAEELSRTPNSLRYPTYTLGYDPQFIDAAGPAAEGAVAAIPTLPFEEGGSNASLDSFLKYYDQVSNGQPPNLQSMLGWATLEIYRQVLESMPGPITRDGLLTAAAKQHQVVGAGLFPDFDFGSRVRANCRIIVRVVDGAYKREAPASGFIC